MQILTGEQMRRVDRRAIDELGVASLLLMEAAGRGVAAALVEDYPDAARRGVLVLCGKGNNGGDGLVAARHLLRRGVQPEVLLLARWNELSGDAAVNLQAARGSGVAVHEAADEAAWSRQASKLSRQGLLVLDAMLGTGVRGGAHGLPALAIEALERAGTTVVAVDLPSGLEADATVATGPAVRAERTYTLCRPKPALVLGPAAEHAGRWRVLPIGIPPAALEGETAELTWFDRREAAARMPRRSPADHKGRLGHLLVVAGSRGKSGAAALVARGALRAGCGLVTTAVPASVRAEVAGHQPEMMTEPLAETGDGRLAGGAERAVAELAGDRYALAIGPGLGAGGSTAAAVRAILASARLPLVADADALNALAAGDEGPAALARGAAPVVLTPHPGEAGRLLGRSASAVQASRLDAARELARRSGAVVLLKGRHTLTATPDGRVAVNASGNPGMASGGTGDVLTGVVGALLARGLAPWTAARLAAFLHGDAGDRAAADCGADGMTASDLAARLPAAFRDTLRADARPEPW